MHNYMLIIIILILITGILNMIKKKSAEIKTRSELRKLCVYFKVYFDLDILLPL